MGLKPSPDLKPFLNLKRLVGKYRSELDDLIESLAEPSRLDIVKDVRQESLPSVEVRRSRLTQPAAAQICFPAIATHSTSSTLEDRQLERSEPKT